MPATCRLWLPVLYKEARWRDENGNASMFGENNSNRRCFSEELSVLGSGGAGEV